MGLRGDARRRRLAGDLPRWPAERDDLLRHALKAAERADAYIAPALRSRPRRTRETAIPGPWAWADVDVAGDDVTDRLGLLGALVVASGSPRCLHAYVPLATPPEDVADLELLNRRLARYLQADAGWSASKVLRLPGTMNRKAPALPRPVVLERTAGAPWALEDLDALLPVVEVRTPPAATVDLDALRAISTRRLPYELAALLAELPDPDRSGQSWRLVATAVGYGLDDAAVLALALQHRPTVAKYGTGDRLVAEVYRALAKLRPEHRHVGRTCSAAHCPTLRDRQAGRRGWRR